MTAAAIPKLLHGLRTNRDRYARLASAAKNSWCMACSGIRPSRHSIAALAPVDRGQRRPRPRLLPEDDAHHAVLYRDTDTKPRCASRPQGVRAWIILDMVGGSYINKNIKLLAANGRLGLQIAFLEGSKARNRATIMTKQLQFHRVHARAH